MQRVVAFDHLRYYSLITRANSFKKRKKKKKETNIIGVHLLFNRQWYFHKAISYLAFDISHRRKTMLVISLLWNLWHCRVLGKYQHCNSRANTGECNSVKWAWLKIRWKWRIRGLWCRIVFEKNQIWKHIDDVRCCCLRFSNILFNYIKILYILLYKSFL